MVHIDVKKTGRIPDGGGWRVHGKNSPEAKAVARTKTRGTKTGYVFLHSAIDGYSRLAYTEALPDEKAVTAIAFLDRARAWFEAHGITRLERIVTDNGSCYRAAAFADAMGASRHQRITPYTPRHNGKICEESMVALHRGRSDPGQGMTMVSCVRFVGWSWCSSVARAGRTDLT
ncbi:hypothetical protein GCM10025862_13960 [Arsenicicoccus piscis]|uniref:Integrase catalytic domain-containing protein n=1 Tax=Arsenicicoccus piscis TaxID=673954 RepID=A0ABQ6HLR5_9MICO|nr:hypothetical protein GCM10025862_13960 [Arsenicicoccus piscis]